MSGVVLPEVSPETIADEIMKLANNRDALHALRAGVRLPNVCSPSELAVRLTDVAADCGA